MLINQHEATSSLYQCDSPLIVILNNCARLRICTESGKLFFGCFSGLKIQQLSSGRGEADFYLRVLCRSVTKLDDRIGENPKVHRRKTLG